MIALFILGLIAGATIAAIIIAILNLKWFYDYSRNIIKNAPNKKVFIVNIKNVYNDLRQMKVIRHLVKSNAEKQENRTISIKNNIEKFLELPQNKKEMLLSELENMCDDTPYVVAEYDEESDTVENYESVKAESTEDDFIKYMEENDGLILVEE